MAADAWPVLFANPAGRILAHPAGYCVLQYAAGERRLGDFRQLLTVVGEISFQRGWGRLLADQRRMSPLTEAESQWMLTNWYGSGELRPSGMFTAVVLSSDGFAGMAISRVLAASNIDPLTYQLFDDHEIAAAEAWLHSRPTVA